MRTRDGGFTLIELMAIVAIVVILSASMRVGIANVIGKTRDARRLADFAAISDALHNYRFEHNSYPNEQDPVDLGMYRFSFQSNFLSDLVPTYFGTPPVDPINDRPAALFDWYRKDGHYYAYYYYRDPTVEGDVYGCGHTTFAVLGIRKLEAGPPKQPQNAYCGPPQPFSCPEGGIPFVCRDWSLEYDYSTLFYD
jgi:type II secretory pathway pseudopilin PulG